MKTNKNIKYLKKSSAQTEIILVCDNLKKFLLEKNKRYGNSALEPIRIYSKSNKIEQLLVRIDDKINRIQNSNIKKLRKNDICDMLGYHILLCIAYEYFDFSDLLD